MEKPIEDLRAELRQAQDEADRRERARTEAGRAEAQAHRDAIDHEAAAKDARLFGRIPTRESRRREHLATECRQAMGRHRQEMVAASPSANDAHAEVSYAQRALDQALENEDPEVAALDREQWREAMATQRVHDTVESDQLNEDEAYTGDGLVRPEAHEKELRKLEADDGLDWDPWSDTGDEDDGGYAEAAAEAKADQLAVRDLDLSIDAGERTFEEVYTPEGDIRQHLLYGEPEPEPEQDRGRDPQRDQRTAPAMEFDEPF